MTLRYDFTARAAAKLALQKLSLSPNIGRPRETIAPGVRSFRVAAHVAFYIQRSDRIVVLRLLHPNMDVDAAFE